MTVTITGASPVLGAVVQAMPSSWPLTNAAGGNATSPGATKVLSDPSSGAYTLTGLPTDANYTIYFANGTTLAGATPNTSGTYTTTQLTSGSGGNPSGATTDGTSGSGGGATSSWIQSTGATDP